jgi:hypothetical protein
VAVPSARSAGARSASPVRGTASCRNACAVGAVPAPTCCVCAPCLRFDMSCIGTYTVPKARRLHAWHSPHLREAAKSKAPKGPVHPAQGVSLGLIVPPLRTTPTGAFMRDWMNRPFRPVVTGALVSPRLRLGLYEPAFQAGAGCAGEFPWGGKRGGTTFPKQASRHVGNDKRLHAGLTRSEKTFVPVSGCTWAFLPCSTRPDGPGCV